MRLRHPRDGDAQRVDRIECGHVEDGDGFGVGRNLGRPDGSFDIDGLGTKRRRDAQGKSQ